MNRKISAIVADDEESARNVLSNLINRFCPEINIISTCANVEEAAEVIKKHQPDVVFLDIEMPNYAGYELVAFFEEVNFDIIFVTAYDQYAIKAFELSAVDYLLKPVEIDRLKEAVKKLVNKTEHQISHLNYKTLTENLKSESAAKIMVRHQGNQEMINLEDIITIEAKESYSCIHTAKGKFLVSKNLKYYEMLFDQNNSFFRTHKSWIINLNHMITFSKTKLEIELNNKIFAKLSRYRKPDFEKFLLQ
ncbi:MAG: LytTR family DNA-binding domain-containing protein [Vicingaceae bacterium]|nr:LytTR family DNA-binding domain-containing protein [Vicingaceae bacterium]